MLPIVIYSSFSFEYKYCKFIWKSIVMLIFMFSFRFIFKVYILKRT